MIMRHFEWGVADSPNALQLGFRPVHAMQNFHSNEQMTRGMKREEKKINFFSLLTTIQINWRRIHSYNSKYKRFITCA